jgi:phosphoglycerate dehydrogenase-like enzyme
MTPRVLLSHHDPDSLAREVGSILGEALAWLPADHPGARDAEVWFCATRPPTEPLDLPSLRWIHSGWAGIETWFSRPEWRADVVLTRTVGDFPRRIAEYVFGYLLARELDVPEALRQMDDRSWKRWVPESLAGRSLLIVGYGEIGRAVGAVGLALGMEVSGIRRGPVDPTDRASGVHPAEEIVDCLGRADVVVNLLPATPWTESFWNSGRFSAMRRGAIFINASRGSTVDEQALLAAIGRGQPARAILDVFREEPLPTSHPLRGHPEIWITPHVAGIGTSAALALEFAEQWRAFRSGSPLRHVVSRERGY